MTYRYVHIYQRPSLKPAERHGVEDVGGVAGIDGADVAAGVNYVGRVLGGGNGALLRRRPWGYVFVLAFRVLEAAWKAPLCL